MNYHYLYSSLDNVTLLTSKTARGAGNIVIIQSKCSSVDLKVRDHLRDLNFSDKWNVIYRFDYGLHYGSSWLL